MWLEFIFALYYLVPKLQASLGDSTSLLTPRVVAPPWVFLEEENRNESEVLG